MCMQSAGSAVAALLIVPDSTCSEGLCEEHVRPESLVLERVVHAAALPEVL